MSGIPVLLEMDGLDILIVGGGALASRRAVKLLDAGARVRVVAPHVTPQLDALRAHPTLSIERRAFTGDDIGAAHLVFAATNDRAVNACVARDARAACRLVIVGDAPEDGTASMMATHRAGTVVIGVVAGGIPGAAARIRDAIGARFDQRYAKAVERLAALRRTMIDRGDREAWSATARVALGDDFCEAVEQGTLDARMAAWR